MSKSLFGEDDKARTVQSPFTGDVFAEEKKSTKLPVTKESVLQEQFLRFHAANPNVYRKLVNLAREAKSRGASRYGMKGLFEVLRWHWLESTVGDEFKLNNNYTAFYARLIMARVPDLEDFFEVRKQKAS